MGDALLQGFHLGIDSYLCSRKTGNAHFHLDELHPTLFLRHCCHLLHLADGGLCEVLNAELCYQPIDNLFLYRCFFHFLFYYVTS